MNRLAMLNAWLDARGLGVYGDDIAKYCGEVDDLTELTASDVETISSSWPIVKKRKLDGAIMEAKRLRATPTVRLLSVLFVEIVPRA